MIDLDKLKELADWLGEEEDGTECEESILVNAAATELRELRSEVMEQAQMLLNQANTIRDARASELALKKELLEYMPSADGLVNGHPDDDPSGYWKELGLRIQQFERDIKESGS